MLIHVAITIRPGWQRRKADLSGTHAVEAITEDLVNRIMGRSVESETVILKPSLVGNAHSPSIGKWDVDEPHPHPDLPATDH